MKTEPTTEPTESASPQDSPVASPKQGPLRRRLPGERMAIVHHFSVGGHKGYLMVGLYEDGQSGEIFIRMAKAGSTNAGLMDSSVSLALQYGVSLKVLCDKFTLRTERRVWERPNRIRQIPHGLSVPLYGLEVSSADNSFRNGRRS